MTHEHWHRHHIHTHIHLWNYCSVCNVCWCKCGAEKPAYRQNPFIYPDPWYPRVTWDNHKVFCNHSTHQT